TLDIGRCEEALPQIKRLEIREPRVTRKAVLGESLEQELGLVILPLGVALGSIMGAPSQRAAQKPEALRHLLAMGLELLSVLGQGAERRMYVLAMLRCLKLLRIETPGKDAGQRLKERVHGGVDTILWGAVRGHCWPLEKERQDDEKRCQSHRVLPW